jgi:hypothetical protein
VAELDGFEAMMAALRAIPERVAAATPTALAQAGHVVEGMVKLELSRTSHPPGTPTPSPPGSPPSLITGALRRSIMVEGPAQIGDAKWRVPASVHGSRPARCAARRAPAPVPRLARRHRLTEPRGGDPS